MNQKTFVQSERKVHDIEDWIKYFDKNLIVGLELELNWKNPFLGLNEDEIKAIFGIYSTGYHDYISCEICGRKSCCEHVPKNLIRAIQRDATINGFEFLVYGNNLDSLSFSKKFYSALENLKEFFIVEDCNSCHIHMLITNQVEEIPKLFIENFWQLYRKYYSVILWLMGTSKDYIHRKSGYAKWETWYLSPTTNDLMQSLKELVRIEHNRDELRYSNNDLEHHVHHIVRSGLNFMPFTFNEKSEQLEIKNFDIEFRCGDGTLNLDQIILNRVLTKAVFLRAVELSQFGLLNVETDESWLRNKELKVLIDFKPNLIKEKFKEYYESHAKDLLSALYNDIAPFLDNLEKSAFKSISENPIWNRKKRWKTIVYNKIIRKQKHSNVKDYLEETIKKRSVKAEEPKLWLESVKNKEFDGKKIKKALRKLPITWDKDLRTYIWNY